MGRAVYTTVLYECVAAAQLDKTKVLCLKYRPQWLCQYKDAKKQ